MKGRVLQNAVKTMELTGKTILITRAVHQAEDFVRTIQQHGGTAIMFPTIDIVPPDSWEACDRAIDSLYMYDGLIFTSSNGVEFFFRRMTDRGGSPTVLKGKTICVVGEKTKQAVEGRNLNVTAMPEKFTSFDLARTLQQEDLKGKSFLFPRGNLGDDQLAGNLKLLGASVDSLIVYKTKRPKEQDVTKIRTMLMEGEIDVITFTSASTVQNFVPLFSTSELENALRKTKIGVIGPVTARAVRELGFEANIVSGESTTESFVQSIIRFFQSEIRNPPPEADPLDESSHRPSGENTARTR